MGLPERVRHSTPTESGAGRSGGKEGCFMKKFFWNTIRVSYFADMKECLKVRKLSSKSMWTEAGYSGIADAVKWSHEATDGMHERNGYRWLTTSKVTRIGSIILVKEETVFF